MMKSLTTLALLAASATSATSANALEFIVGQDRSTFQAAFAKPAPWKPSACPITLTFHTDN